MTALEDRLDAIQHRRLALDPDVEVHERGCYRPDLACWGSFEPEHGGGVVSLKVDALMGQPTRFVSLTPDEARRLARRLITPDEARRLARRLIETANDVECACAEAAQEEFA